MIKSACLFCGARSGSQPRFAEVATELGKRFAEAGIELVYGGGKVGLMGLAAEACMKNGGEVTGVIPLGLFDREIAHTGLTRLISTESLHERKATMAKLSQAFIAMPGGFGTLDELCEILTWRQLAIHDKPILLLDVDGFWSGFLAFVETCIQNGFIPRDNLKLFQLVSSPEDAIRVLKSYDPATTLMP